MIRQLSKNKILITKADGIYKTEFIRTSCRFQESRHFFFNRCCTSYFLCSYILTSWSVLSTMHVFCMKRDGKKRSQKRWPSGGLRPPGPPTRASALDPMGALGVPQTPRRSSLIAHSFSSSYSKSRRYPIYAATQQDYLKMYVFL